MTLLVFSGTVQLASLPLIAADAPLWVVMLTAVVVNLRFMIFSAGLHPFFRRFSIGAPVAAQLLHGRHELRDVSCRASLTLHATSAERPNKSGSFWA